jgi:hypothetical protein
MRPRSAIATIATVLAAGLLVGSCVGEWGEYMRGSEYTVDERLMQFGRIARARLLPEFAGAGVAYPPDEIALVAFKDARQLSLYARSHGKLWRHVRRYPILAASGAPGPKLCEGDRQVPEGVYRVVALNPNSRFHVSLRLDYPNAFDRAMGTRDGRNNLGGEIAIHGKARSFGCLAVGDKAIEELFTLAHDAGLERIRVVIAPTDLRRPPPVVSATAPPWTPVLYGLIRAELAQYPFQLTRALRG